MKVEDLMIGIVDNYTYDKIEPWIVSLERTGFSGKKLLIVYNMGAATAKKITDRGIEIFAFNRDDEGNCTYPKKDDFSLMVERFAHVWYFLTNSEELFDKVIMTDVRDVVFQSDPFENEVMKAVWNEVVVGTENIRLQDEPWGRDNMRHSFGPMIYETVKDNPIYCAGVIGGSRHHLADFCLNIYLMCMGAPKHVPGGGGPDQAAMNVMLSLQAYRTTTTKTAGSFVAHLGTSLPAVAAGSGGAGEIYKNNLDEYEKLLIWSEELKMEDDIVYKNGEKVDILHQYDRIPVWDFIIQQKYRE